MQQMLKLSARQNLKAAIILLDLDRFKQINDSYGHHIGDELLKSVVNRIGGIIRESDEIVRLGGDEFIVLLPLTDATQAGIVAEKMQQAMQEPFVFDGVNIDIVCSMGISIFPDDSDDDEVLIRMADKAMYEAKSGPTKTIFYHEVADLEINRVRLD
jgi:diguanylate cyclase (GGDEF)-like protein